ncbi:MAG: T9SS type A sorting domain-containing protein [Bacteroidales bacterium]|nr:T9SS type A sorting domain-containing protein [Bacteroidales bacterium]MBO5835721.1 T9SS type A sorting domain-containing protein [Bacteroidales bacterium]MBO7184069.1 T9SS type A sorting domain-containing protein [Bacteroidales bacterium]
MKFLKHIFFLMALWMSLPLLAEYPQAMNMHYDKYSHWEVRSFRLDDISRIVFLDQLKLQVCKTDASRENFDIDRLGSIYFGPYKEPVALEQTERQGDFDVFFRGRETLLVESAQPLKQVRLLDASGKTILSIAGNTEVSEQNSMEISLPELPAGLYLVVAQGAHSVKVKKIMLK